MKKTILLLCFLANVMLFAQDGSIDPNYNIGTGFDSTVFGSALTSSGKIVAVGNFLSYNGATANKICRLNTDGTIDTTFNTGGSGASTGSSDFIFAITPLANGKFYIGGTFTTYNGVARNSIALINADGSLDASFNPPAVLSSSSTVYKILIQNDGKILAVGPINIAQPTNSGAIRFNTDGSVDATFNIGTGFDNTVGDVVELPGGKLLFGGSFGSYKGIALTRPFMLLLSSTGAVDTSFALTGSPDGPVNLVRLQSTGKIVVGGTFTTINGISGRLRRLNSDGTTDTSFNPGTGANNLLRLIKVVAADKMYIGGLFTTVEGTSRPRIARLNADGSLDTTFEPGTGLGADARSAEIQSDAKIVLFGSFTTYQGTAKNRIVRVGDISLANKNSIVDAVVSFYPNPVSNVLNIDLQTSASVEIIDALGKTVITNTLELGTNQLNTGALTAGLYFAKITATDNQSKTIKFIKQ